jgi:hypothetical protein
MSVVFLVGCLKERAWWAKDTTPAAVLHSGALHCHIHVKQLLLLPFDEELKFEKAGRVALLVAVGEIRSLCEPLLSVRLVTHVQVKCAVVEL